ncbi:TPA: hypothetical protein ACS72K_001083 [Providencia alcalifaciens]
MNELEKNKKFLEFLRNERDELDHEFNVSRFDFIKSDERLNSEFAVKYREDFASDPEYKKFIDNQHKLFDDYHQSRKKMEEAEAKLNKVNELIREAEGDNKPAKKAEQTIQAQDEEKLDLNIKLDPSKSSSSQDNIDATANRLAEGSASIKVDASVSDHAKNSESVNSYNQIIFNDPGFKMGFQY